MGGVPPTDRFLTTDSGVFPFIILSIQAIVGVVCVRVCTRRLWIFAPRRYSDSNPFVEYAFPNATTKPKPTDAKPQDKLGINETEFTRLDWLLWNACVYVRREQRLGSFRLGAKARSNPELNTRRVDILVVFAI